MKDRNNVEKVVESIKKWAQDQGMEIAEPTDFFEGIDKLYEKLSLKEVVEEELPRILGKDLRFFEKYDIDLPENQEGHLFDLYYNQYGKRGMDCVYHSAKVWFRHLRFFLINHPDQDELNNAVNEYKRILDGNYFNEPA